jgi:hypothetical protein
MLKFSPRLRPPTPERRIALSIRNCYWAKGTTPLPPRALLLTPLGNIPTKITEAQGAGWESLEARCEKCRVSVHVPWRLLRMRSESEDLCYIMQRAVC